MADKTDENRQWDAIAKMQDILTRIETTTARLEQKMDSHMADPSIHTRPPCEHYKSLTSRVWALFIAIIGLAGTVFAALIK